jgi:N-acetylmuramoyl-L-alanine amidase
LQPSQSETSLQSGLFIVQIGAFEDPSNAEKTALQATEKGFHTFIKQEDKLYKVQIGAFKERINAEELVQEARTAGLTAALTIN